MMGVYQRVEGKDVNGRGVWQAVGGIGDFLYYDRSRKQWLVSERESMEANNGNCFMLANSTAATPDQITEQWKINAPSCSGWTGLNAPKGTEVNAPNLRVRVCSSVEKHAAEQCVEQEQALAFEQARQSRRLVAEGLVNDQAHLMGVYVYELMEGKVVSRRAVWQKQGGGGEERFLYYVSSTNAWYFTSRKSMETGRSSGFMHLVSAALTPDQARPSAVWRVDDGTQWEANPEVRVRRQQQ
jgi:hypothetical protein